MNECEWADRFHRDVDSLLNRSERTGSNQEPAEYREALDLARILATTDFSGESRVRETLRRRLLHRTEAREGWQIRKEIPMRTFFWQRHPALVLATVVLVAIFVVALAWPGALTVAAQGIENFVQTLVLGQNTSVQQVNLSQAAPATRAPRPATPVVERRGDIWIIKTAIGNFSGNVPPGADTSVRRFQTVKETQAVVSFDLREPGYLPAGYALREGMVALGGWAFLFYGGPEGDIILYQTAVGSRPGSEAGQASATAVGVLTDQPIEPATLNGQPAAWIESHGLIWEADGVSYTLGGANLSLDEAIRIAESLK